MTRVSSPAQALESAYNDREAAAQRHRASGGRVVGHVSTSVPTELIEAAGLFPLLVTADRNRPTPLADEWMERQFDPMARAIFDRALAGELASLDLLVIPRTADSFMRLYLYLREIERLGRGQQLPPLAFLDLLQTTRQSTVLYDRARLAELRDKLAALAQRDVPDERIRAAIGVANENRAALRELTARRGDASRPLAGSTAIAALGARWFMPIREHTALVSALAASRDAPPPPQSVPVLLGGNAQDDAALHLLLQDSGFNVVADYHWMGDWCCAADVATDGDPLLALAEHYQRRSLTSRVYPLDPEDVVAEARRSGAAAAVFYLFEEEEALTWDVPSQVEALEKAGFPSLVLDRQPYAVDARVREALTEFRLSLGKGPVMGARS